MRKVDTVESAEAFVLKHGENIVDRVGAEIDRIERNLRVRNSIHFRFQFIHVFLSLRKNIRRCDMWISKFFDRRNSDGQPMPCNIIV